MACILTLNGMGIKAVMKVASRGEHDCIDASRDPLVDVFSEAGSRSTLHRHTVSSASRPAVGE